MSSQGVVRVDRINKVDGDLPLSLIISFKAQVLLPPLLGGAGLFGFGFRPLPMSPLPREDVFTVNLDWHRKDQARGLPAICEYCSTTHSLKYTASGAYRECGS